ncbi:CHASE2 domain-containing protein [Phenylobacterium sp.]|uniref:CHASE2 domain-containing protein n=1 Tax=Phenylobacterium sp. TaxID=1871053 RepID=UPI002C9F4549|nr:CHASE2 domain-containing protein [Phenylobacterium sp.]HLZ77299.1 CHASE2 domain-containing protein [Phenylobacterium sp.]
MGGIAAAILAALTLLTAGDAIRQPLFDTWQRLAAPVPPPPSAAAVVLIDGPSLKAVGGWPWSRYVMARLTEAIASRGAKAIGFDILFPEADRTTPGLFADLYPELPKPTADEIRKLPSMDAIFARVIGRSPVVLGRAGIDKDSLDLVGGAAPAPPEAQFTGAAPSGIFAYPEVGASLTILDGAALGHALYNGPKDPDGVTRRVPLVARAAGTLTPGFALELVRVAEGEDGAKLISNGGRLRAVQLGRHTLPVDAQGRMALRFRGLKGADTISAVELLRTGVRPDIFKNKIVLVGLAAAGTSDIVTTPTGVQTYGVLVQAEAVNNIVGSSAKGSGGLYRPDWAMIAEWSLGLLAAAAAWWFTPRLGLLALVTAAVALTGLAVGTSYGGFLQQGWLLDPAPVLAPGVATAAAMIALLFVEGRRVQARLRGALDEERVSAAKIAGELSAAAEIQSGMLLPREALRRVSSAVEIDAVLQPAKSVGGDLYDAFMIDKTRLCFLVGDVTGKGVPASLFMALSKALSRSFLMRPEIGLDMALDGINAELSRDNGQAMAVSLLVGVLDLADGTLDLCNAGHENPLVVDSAGAVRELRLEGGPALCVAEDFPYPVERHRLEPSETLIVYTDGVTEAQNPTGDLFDREGAMAVLSAKAAQPLAEMIDALISAVRAFEAGEDPSDDLTVLAVRRPA